MPNMAFVLNENMKEKKSAVDKGLIRDLAAILTETDLTEIEVEQDDLRIRVSRQCAQVQPVQVSSPMPAAAPVAAPAAAPDAATQAEAPAVSSASAVTSPMVGTAYHSPAPGADPFVKVGDSVREGDTVMIVEAMKTMNQIPAPRAGKVTRIMVANAEPVEFGAPLMIVE